jgi:hypothetical protein
MSAVPWLRPLVARPRARPSDCNVSDTVSSKARSDRPLPPVHWRTDSGDSRPAEAYDLGLCQAKFSRKGCFLPQTSALFDSGQPGATIKVFTASTPANRVVMSQALACAKRANLQESNGELRKTG